jgi:hypothetical protein
MGFWRNTMQYISAQLGHLEVGQAFKRVSKSPLGGHFHSLT